MANAQNQPERQYSVEEEQALAQEAIGRGMTVEDLKKERARERKDVTSQGTDDK